MRRSTEKIIAVQLLTVVVAVTGLLLAQLLAGPRHGIAVGTASPWHSFKRLMHRAFLVGKHDHVAPVPPEPPATPENTRDR